MTADHPARPDGALRTSPRGRVTPAPTRHTLRPIWQLAAVAPSGGEIRFVRYDEKERSLSWYQGALTVLEERVFWSAKLKADKPSRDAWAAAERLLRNAGWTILETQQ